MRTAIAIVILTSCSIEMSTVEQHEACLTCGDDDDTGGGGGMPISPTSPEAVPVVQAAAAELGTAYASVSCWITSRGGVQCWLDAGNWGVFCQIEDGDLLCGWWSD